MRWALTDANSQGLEIEVLYINDKILAFNKTHGFWLRWSEKMIRLFPDTSLRAEPGTYLLIAGLQKYLAEYGPRCQRYGMDGKATHLLILIDSGGRSRGGFQDCGKHVVHTCILCSLQRMWNVCLIIHNSTVSPWLSSGLFCTLIASAACSLPFATSFQLLSLSVVVTEDNVRILNASKSDPLNYNLYGAFYMWQLQ